MIKGRSPYQAEHNVVQPPLNGTLYNFILAGGPKASLGCQGKNRYREAYTTNGEETRAGLPVPYQGPPEARPPGPRLITNSTQLILIVNPWNVLIRETFPGPTGQGPGLGHCLRGDHSAKGVDERT